MAGHDASHQCLLLLPRPPSEMTIQSLRVAYGPSMSRVLGDLAQVSAKSTAHHTDVSLSVSVAHNVLSGSGYKPIQQFFGLMYKLICIISTESKIDVQFGNDVDVRVMLFRTEERGQADISAPGAARFISLADLARSQRPWSRVYSVESEIGEELLQDFLRHHESFLPSLEYAITRVPGGLTMNTGDSKDTKTRQEKDDAWSSHHSVADGGTFDHLHAGHKLLLTMTALVLDPIDESDTLMGRYLTIGITGDKLLEKKRYPEELEDWNWRQSSVRSFLLDFLSFLSPGNVLKNSEIVADPQTPGREVCDELRSGLQIKYKEIFDPYGPTITDPKISALVISGETRAGGKAVNDKRAEKDWQLLEVFEVDVLDAGAGTQEQSKDDFGSKISSTEIRSRIRQRRHHADENN